MEKSLDKLIEFLLGEIAVSGPQGVTPDQLQDFVTSFYDKNQTTARSTEPLADAGTSCDQLVDEDFVHSVWAWLGSHDDVSIGKNRQYNSTPLTDIHRNGGGRDKDSQQTTENDVRLYVSEERTYRAICGHGLDATKVFPSEYILLSHIAAARSEGILQGNLTRASGQDKRSVPKRTDALHKKGYILKEPVYVHGTRTSRLTLRRYRAAVEQTDSAEDPSQGETVQDVAEAVMKILTDEERIMTVDELLERAGMTTPKLEKVLAKIVRQLERIGCVKRVRMASHDGGLQQCVRYVHAPTAEDYQRFDSLQLQLKSSVEQIATDLTADAENAVEGTETVDSLEIVDTNTAVPMVQWNPDRNMTSMISDAVFRAGTSGLNNALVRNMITGPFVRRTLESLLARISFRSLYSQPPHLQHLAIIRTGGSSDGYTDFTHFSLPAFLEAVRMGSITAKNVPGIELISEHLPADQRSKKKSTKSPKAKAADLDQFGFPLLQPENQVMNGKMSFADIIRDIAAGDVIARSGEPALRINAAGEEYLSEYKRAVVEDDDFMERTPRKSQPKPKPKFTAPRQVMDDGSEKIKGRPRKFLRGTEKFWQHQFFNAKMQVSGGGGRKNDKLKAGVMNDPAGLALFEKRPQDFDDTLASATEAGLPVPILPEDINAEWVHHTRHVLQRSADGAYLTPVGMYIGKTRYRSQILIFRSSRLNELDLVEKFRVPKHRFISSSHAHSFATWQDRSRQLRAHTPAMHKVVGESHKTTPSLRRQSTNGPRLGIFVEPIKTVDVAEPRTNHPANLATVDLTEFMDSTDIDSELENQQGAAQTPAVESTPGNNRKKAIVPAQQHNHAEVTTNHRATNGSHKVSSPNTRPIRQRKMTQKAAEALNEPEHQVLSPSKPATTHGSSPVLTRTLQGSGLPDDNNRSTKQTLDDAVSRHQPDSPASIPTPMGQTATIATDTMSAKETNQKPGDQLPTPDTQGDRGLQTPHRGVTSPNVSTAVLSSESPGSIRPHLVQSVDRQDPILVEGNDDHNQQERTTSMPRISPTTTTLKAQEQHTVASVEHDPHIPEVQTLQRNGVSETQEASPRSDSVSNNHFVTVNSRTPDRASATNHRTVSPNQVQDKRPPTTPSRKRKRSLSHFSEDDEDEDDDDNQHRRGRDAKRSKQKPGRNQRNALCRRIVLELVALASGAAPNNASTIRRVMTNRWRASGELDDRPLLNSLKLVIKRLFEAGRLKNIIFTFTAKSGAMEKKSILTLPGVNAAGPLVQEVKQKMIDADATEYVPPEWEHEARQTPGTILRQRIIAAPVRSEPVQPVVEILSDDEYEPPNSAVSNLSGFLTLKCSRLGELPKVQEFNARLKAQRQRNNIVPYTPRPAARAIAPAPTRFVPPLSISSRGIIRPRQTLRPMIKPKARIIVWKQHPEPEFPPKSLQVILEATCLKYPALKPPEAATAAERFVAEVDAVAKWEESSAELFNIISIDWRFINHNSAVRGVDAPPVAFAAMLAFDENGKQVTRKYPNAVSWPPFAKCLAAMPVSDTSAMNLSALESNNVVTQRLTRQRTGKLRKRKLDVVVEEGPPEIPPIKRRRRRRNIRDREDSVVSIEGLEGVDEDTIHRIIIATTCVRSLTGGLDGSIDWDMVVKILPEEDEDAIQKQWEVISEVYLNDIQNSTQQFQEKYLEALEDDAVPSVDFDDLDNTDWDGIYEWAEETLDFVDSTPRQVLPPTRSEFDATHSLNFVEFEGLRSLLQYTQYHTQRQKEKFLSQTIFGTTFPLPEEDLSVVSSNRSEHQAPDLMIARSHILAAILTPDAVYDPTRTQSKLLSLSPSRSDHELLVSQVLSSLQRDKIIARRKADLSQDVQHIGVRIWEVQSKYLDNFNARRIINRSMLVVAGNYKLHKLDMEFKQGKPVYMEKEALIEDGEMVAIMNLMSQGMVKIKPGNDVPNSRYGIDHQNVGYQTRHIEAKKFAFSVQVEATATYVFGDVMGSHRQILVPRGEAGQPKAGRYPFWVDINANLLPDIWEMVLAAVIGLISVRPGMPTKEVGPSLNNALTEWEAGLVLDWAERAKFVCRSSSRQGGWQPTGWWWHCLGVGAEQGWQWVCNGKEKERR